MPSYPSRSGGARPLFESRENPPARYLIAHSDGGARGNPGPAGYGVVIQDDQLLSGSIADSICFFDESFELRASAATRLPPFEPQHRNSLDFAEFFGHPTATRSGTAFARCQLEPQGRETRGRSGAGLGDLSDAAPIWAWPGTPSPVQFYTPLPRMLEEGAGCGLDQVAAGR